MRWYLTAFSILLLVFSVTIAEDAPATTDSGGGGGSATSSGTSGGGTTDSGSASGGSGTTDTGTSGGGTDITSGGGSGGGEGTPPPTEPSGGGSDAPTPVDTSSPVSTPMEQPDVGPPVVQECPQPPSMIMCDGQVATKFDGNGCIVGYDCLRSQQKQGCNPPPRPGCPENTRLEANYDVNGCEVGYNCVGVEGGEDTGCPQDYRPVCGSNGKTYSNDCFARADGVGVESQGKCENKNIHFCGNFKCEIGEDQYNCHDDCGKPTPEGCRVERDQNGFEKYVCEGDFKPVCKDIKYDTDKCYSAGGNPKKSTDPSGCEIIQCEFGNKGRSFNPIQQGPSQCQSADEIRQITKKCESMGIPVQMSVIGENCKTARCGQKEEKMCPEISYEVREEIKDKCSSQGMQVIYSFDEKGCKVLQCTDTNACQRDVPKEAYSACQQEGGELIVKRAEDGCVSFVDCVHRGNENDVYVEEIRDIPSSTELFGIAMKLEELRIEFDKLARQTNEIAEYYKSVGSDDEQRFRRVSDMFFAAKDKIDETKTELRDKLQDITTDDLMMVRQDIKYIKDVMIKDIVYLMLSTSDDVKELTKKSSSDCGRDGSCFDRAIRVCKSITFHPESDGPYVQITGLEGDACIVKLILPEGQGPPAGAVPGINPPYEAACKIEKYALGIRNPDTDLLPYCSGNLIELMNKFGKGPGQGGGDEFDEQPRTAQSTRNVAQEGFCECTWEAGSAEHPEGCPVFCSSYPDQQFCEDESASGCKWVQTTSQQRVVSQRPVKPVQPIEPMNSGEQLCPDGICDDFEQSTGACPEDCEF